MTAEGGPGCGKTDFFYRTFPRPALVIQLDLNDEGIRERYANDPDIVFKDVIVPPFVVHTEEQRVKDLVIGTMVRDLYKAAIESGIFRSIMIDEGYALYELARRSFLVGLGFGESEQQSYTPVNAYMERFFTRAKQHRINFYLPHQQKEERETFITDKGKKGSRLTGGMAHAGWKKALYQSQCHVEFVKDEKFKPDKDAGEKPIDKFTMRIVKCTANTAVEGLVLQGNEISLETLGVYIWPLSDEGDWRS